MAGTITSVTLPHSWVFDPGTVSRYFPVTIGPCDHPLPIYNFNGETLVLQPGESVVIGVALDKNGKPCYVREDADSPAVVEAKP